MINHDYDHDQGNIIMQFRQNLIRSEQNGQLYDDPDDISNILIYFSNVYLKKI